MKYALLICIFVPIVSFSQQKQIRIESVRSLYIEVYHDNFKLGSATGFVIRPKSQNYLITNWHVITDKNPITQQWLDTNHRLLPNRILIMHNGKTLGTYVSKWENLFDKKGKQLWFQTPVNHEMVDVIELPLIDTNDVTIYPVPYKSSFDTLSNFKPTDQVFILGYPLGVHSAPFLPIWKSGTIASEPSVDQENKPITWVDGSSFPGMSGSPVYFISTDLIDKYGNRESFVGQVSIFLGVFSHTYNGVINAFWKAEFLREIFDKLP